MTNTTAPGTATPAPTCTEDTCGECRVCPVCDYPVCPTHSDENPASEWVATECYGYGWTLHLQCHVEHCRVRECNEAEDEHVPAMERDW